MMRIAKQEAIQEVLKKIRKIANKAKDPLQIVIGLEENFDKIGVGDNDCLDIIRTYDFCTELCKYYKKKGSFITLAVFSRGRKEDDTYDFIIQYIRTDADEVKASRLFQYK